MEIYDNHEKIKNKTIENFRKNLTNSSKKLFAQRQFGRIKSNTNKRGDVIKLVTGWESIIQQRLKKQFGRAKTLSEMYNLYLENREFINARSTKGIYGNEGIWLLQEKKVVLKSKMDNLILKKSKTLDNIVYLEGPSYSRNKPKPNSSQKFDESCYEYYTQEIRKCKNYSEIKKIEKIANNFYTDRLVYLKDNNVYEITPLGFFILCLRYNFFKPQFKMVTELMSNSSAIKF